MVQSTCTLCFHAAQRSSYLPRGKGKKPIGLLEGNRVVPGLLECRSELASSLVAVVLRPVFPPGI